DRNINKNNSELVIIKEGIDFDFFWNDYDKKVGEKSKIKKKWDSLSMSDQNAILDHIPKYKKSQPEKQFRKHPETYLNNKSWLDEIIESAPAPIKISSFNAAIDRDKTLQFNENNFKGL